jgi:hypothetical protein
LVDYLLVAYEITERDVQALLNAERIVGHVQIDGMKARERMPKDGHSIRLTAGS